MDYNNNTPLSCYLCGSTSCTQIHNSIRYNLPPRPYRCEKCGFTFIHPKMSVEQEYEFYEKIYRLSYVDQNPDTLWVENLPEAKRRVARFQTILHKDAHLLEIGCASGYFLSEVKKRVNSVKGIELTKDYVQYAISKGLDVRESIEEIDDESFDIIFMFHVLEHINDPIRFIEAVKKKLTPKGKLIIEVPNVDDILVSTYKIKKHLDFYWEVAHNYYFSKDSLGTVLERAGYSFTIFPLQRYDLSNHIRWMLSGEPGGQGYYNKIFTQPLLKEYEKALKAQFLCDTIYAIATKVDFNDVRF
ncbi:MAG: class I SAM-dependent methyltransferase [Candidatus Thermoplasmatota archaeon]|nr:class I SAM-dependent methyltransferase [Candidatus Thermoplasmatota archaeon]